MPHDWIARRMDAIEVSGIRKVFDLARALTDPVNLSIGQPHFPTPRPIQDAVIQAIRDGHNGYTVTQGDAGLLADLRDDLAERFPGAERTPIVTSGTAGGLLLALLATVDPGDEVIVFDPYFVAYPHMVTLAGGTSVYVDLTPDLDLDRPALSAALSRRTKAILLCSPGNPSGRALSAASIRAVAELARARDILLISDEIYRAFHFDEAPPSPAAFNPDTLVVEGFGKTYGVTGWRLGWVHGPRDVVEQMMKLQQFTFICAPSMAQQGARAALRYDTADIVADYRRKRDMIHDGLKGRYELARPTGAFYAYPRVPWGSDEEFVAEAIRRNLLIIPGSVFSRHHTHFRVSFAASDETLERGIDILRGLALR